MIAMFGWRLWMVLGITVGLLSSLFSGLSSTLQRLAGEFELGASQKIEKELTLEAPKKIRLENGIGKIDIKVWDEAKIKLEAIKRTKNERDLEKIEILTEVGENAILIRARAPERLRFAVDYVLVLPQNVELEVDNGIGEVSIKNVESATVHLGIGGLRGLGLKNAKIEAGIGGIEIEGAPQDMTINVGMGGVELKLPADVSLAVKARAGLGGIDLADFSDIKLLSRERAFVSETVELVLGAGEGKLWIEVGIGGIDLKAQSAR